MKRARAWRVSLPSDPAQQALNVLHNADASLLGRLLMLVALSGSSLR